MDRVDVGVEREVDVDAGEGGGRQLGRTNYWVTNITVIG